MKGYIDNIEKVTLENTDFRRVLYTTHHLQLVVMCIEPGQEIGEEVHELDQFIRVEAGMGKAMLDDVEHPLTDGVSIIIPRGTKHNVINTSADDLKLYTLYAPPEHRDQLIHHTKEEAESQEEHFDGQTTD